MTTKTDEFVQWYVENSFSPIPVPSGKKGPKIPDWPELRIQSSDIPKYFTSEPTNVGLILGVDGLADVDLDCPEALSVADHFLPKTGFVFGRKSRPQSHYFYWLDEPIPTKKYLDPLKKGHSTLLELRCTKGDGEIGLQTIVPPSVHPSGERIRFYVDGDPASVKADAFVRAVNMTAAAALLVRYWPGEKCGRNEAFLALSGTLARAGFSLADGIHFVRGIYRGLFGAESDMEQAAREVEATFKKMSAGMGTTGLTHLTDFIDERVVRLALLLLSVQDGGATPACTTSDSKSQATELVALGSGTKLFHTVDDEAYACLQVDAHREIWRLKDREFKRWLAKNYYDQHGKAPRSQAMSDALAVLEGKATFAGEQHDVFVRIARLKNAIYLDLGDESWRAVKITRSGWKVVRRPKVRFRRPRGLGKLPKPMSGGSIKELRQFLNVARKDDWVILVAWLVGAFQPDQPFAILVLQGEQGSAKSTAAKLLRLLIDPNKSPLRSPPRDIRDISIAAQNGWIVAFDNISYLPPWLSDVLCRLATGGGFSTRELYTDAQETLFDAKRPILLNGIDGVVVRGDALDRALVLTLPEITEAKRKPEKELWASFREAQPRILGALLDAVAGALRDESNVNISALPRMADFAIWSTAAEESLGWRPGTVVRAITSNQNETKTLPLVRCFANNTSASGDAPR